MKGIEKFEDLLMHNYEVMKNELIKISQYIKQGRLREYVEGKANLSTHLASIVRLMDAEHYEYQEKRYPITGKKFVSSLYSLRSNWAPNLFLKHISAIVIIKPPLFTS